MDASKRKLNIEYTFVQVFYWMGFCICINFASVFLQGRGYSNSSLGLVMALGNVAGFLISPYLAQLVDLGKHLDVFRCLRILIICQLVIQIIFLLFRAKSIFISILYCIYIACNATVNAMNTQLSFELDGRSGKINYGMTRGLGCIGFSVTAFLLGNLVKSFGSDIISYVGLGVLVMQLAVIIMLSPRTVQKSARQNEIIMETQALSTLSFIKTNPLFCVLLLGVALIYTTHNLSNSFLINVVRNVGGDAGIMGALSSYMAVMELPIMLFYSKAENKLSCSSLLQVSAIMFVLKSLFLSIAPSVEWLFAAQSFQGVSFALLTPAIVQYTSMVIPPADSAKGQSLAFAMSSLGSAFACGFGGILYDSISVRSTLLIGVSVCAIGAGICVFAVRSISRIKKCN